MILNGQSLMVFLKKDGEQTYTSIAYATSHQLSIQANMTDISTKDAGNGIWTNQDVSTLSWSMTTDNLVADVSEDGLATVDLARIMLERKPVELCFSLYTDSDNFSTDLNIEYKVPSGGWKADTTNMFHGKAYITDLNVTATNGEKAQMSATFTGVANLMMAGEGIQKKK